MTSLLAYQIGLLLYCDGHFLTTIGHFLADSPHHCWPLFGEPYQEVIHFMDSFSTKKILTFTSSSILTFGHFPTKCLTFPTSHFWQNLTCNCGQNNVAQQNIKMSSPKPVVYANSYQIKHWQSLFYLSKWKDICTTVSLHGTISTTPLFHGMQP